MKKVIVALAIALTAATGAFAQEQGKKDRDCAKEHARREHDVAERVVERLIPGFEKNHEKAAQRECEQKKVSDARRP